MANPLPTVVVDIIEGARLRERDGKVVEVARTAIVHGIPPGTFDSVLKNALVFLNVNGQPPGALHPNIAGLVLRDRVPRAIDPQIVQVELVYRQFDEPTPPLFPIAVRGSASSAQIETMVDRNGTPIEVEHQAAKQGGVIHPFVADRTLQLSEVAQSADPTLSQDVFSNTVNAGNFFFDCQAAPRTWLLERYEFELLDAESTPLPTWQFRYGLRKKQLVIAGVAGSHDPQVFFKDPETGQPPEGLVAGLGYKTVPWHSETDFRVLFGACGF